MGRLQRIVRSREMTGAMLGYLTATAGIFASTQLGVTVATGVTASAMLAGMAAGATVAHLTRPKADATSNQAKATREAGRASEAQLAAHRVALSRIRTAGTAGDIDRILSRHEDAMTRLLNRHAGDADDQILLDIELRKTAQNRKAELTKLTNTEEGA